MLAAIFAGLLGACRVHTSEAERYLTATADLDPVGCRRLAEGVRAEECLAVVAEALGDVSLCSELTTYWRDECFFLLADTVTQPLADTLLLCGQAGQYAMRCVDHALQGAVGRYLGESDHRVGYRELDAFLAPHTDERKRREVLSGALASARLEGLLPDSPLTVGVCAELPEEVCALIAEKHFWRAVVSEPRRSPLRHRLCPAPVGVEEAVALGLPAWDVELDGAAQRAWGVFCRSRQQ